MLETYSFLDNQLLYNHCTSAHFLGRMWCTVLKSSFPFFMGKIWNVWENSCYRINYAKKGEAFLSFLWRKRLMSVRLRVYSAAKMLNVSSTAQLAVIFSSILGKFTSSYLGTKNRIGKQINEHGYLILEIYITEYWANSSDFAWH